MCEYLYLYVRRSVHKSRVREVSGAPNGWIVAQNVRVPQRLLALENFEHVLIVRVVHLRSRVGGD